MHQRRWNISLLPCRQRRENGSYRITNTIRRTNRMESRVVFTKTTCCCGMRALLGRIARKRVAHPIVQKIRLGREERFSCESSFRSSTRKRCLRSSLWTTCSIRIVLERGWHDMQFTTTAKFVWTFSKTAGRRSTISSTYCCRYKWDSYCVVMYRAF